MRDKFGDGGEDRIKDAEERGGKTGREFTEDLEGGVGVRMGSGWHFESW